MERVLIRIREVLAHEILVSIPGWQTRQIVEIQTKDIPSELLDGLGPGDYLIANVNIGAESRGDLRFNNFEAAPEPAEIIP